MMMMKLKLALAVVLVFAVTGLACDGFSYSGSYRYSQCGCMCNNAARRWGTSRVRFTYFPSGTFSTGGCSCCKLSKLLASEEGDKADNDSFALEENAQRAPSSGAQRDIVAEAEERIAELIKLGAKERTYVKQENGEVVEITGEEPEVAQAIEEPQDMAVMASQKGPLYLKASFCYNKFCASGYTGTYENCLRSCKPYPWKDGTYKVVFFPWGSFSSGGCTCSGLMDACDMQRQGL